jgi:acetyl-CoA C-acetyltransferase
MENMDRAPYLLDGWRWGYRMGPAQVLDSMLTDGLLDAFSGEHSGWNTEDLVTKLGITWAEQDAFAARSQQPTADSGLRSDRIALGRSIVKRKPAYALSSAHFRM